MAKYLELRRHTDSDDDQLSEEGVLEALRVGEQLEGGYDVLISSGAQRATQTLGCFLAALGERVRRGVVVETGLRSEVEDRWKAAYQEAGSGELSAFREVDPELVEQDSARLGEALRRVLDALPDRCRALAVGHSPTNEAAVLGLTGETVESMGKGEGVLIEVDGDDFHVRPLG
ncbi:MAG: histidine phosphatase family protein [Actinomycetota bacterium]|nr:histidine phosphatase family protein [Actinomycetota bacterium]